MKFVVIKKETKFLYRRAVAGFAQLLPLFVFVSLYLLVISIVFSGRALAIVNLPSLRQEQILQGSENPSALAQTGATYKIITDTTGQPTIQVTGAGASVTLRDVKNALSVTDSNKLLDQGAGIWRLNANLLIGAGVTLTVSPETGVNELQMRSESNTADISPTISQTIAYTNFVYLRAVDGTINLESIKVYSWDTSAGKVDEYHQNGRAYILAKFAATLNIRNAEISYLGADENESFGISWRDQNPLGAPNALRTRVTGEVINSNFHHNFYGIYTYQAANMLFRGNQFHHNVRYGFDPHDFSHHFVVENNIAYENGAHGFIISRGCNNFIIRNNKAYNNSDPSSSRAHGFMLDPGGVSSVIPQAPSNDNLLENNEAYGNEGYGLRILSSNNNRIVKNYFHDNFRGLSLSNSEQNVIEGNRIEQSATQGIELLLNSRTNTFTENIIANNITHGIDLEEGSLQNVFLRNIIRSNFGVGIKADGVLTINNLWSQNSLYANMVAGITLSNGANQNIAPPTVSTATNRQVSGKTIPSGIVEIYTDEAGQARYYEGVIMADPNGDFVFNNAGNWQAPQLTLLVRDAVGNTSIFAPTLPVPGAATSTPTPVVSPTPTVTPTPTATNTPTATDTPTVTNTPVDTPTSTPTITPEPTPEPTLTKEVSPTPVVIEAPNGGDLNRFIYLPWVQR